MIKTRKILNLATKGSFAKDNIFRSLIAQNTNINQPSNFTQTQRYYTDHILASNALITIPNNPPTFFPRQPLATDVSPIPNTFSCEAILEEIAKQINPADSKPFKNVMVVAIQHILGTTIEMFKVLKRLGLERVIIGGKSYSTHKGSIQELKNLGYTFIDAPDQLGYGCYDGCMQETVTNIWNAALEAMKKEPAELLIILDDGGDLILSTPGKLFNGISYKPKRVVAIEQTRGGSNHRRFNGVPFPIINVAGSYVKTSIEYPWVAEIVAAKVIKEIQKKAEVEFVQKPIIGVVGNGTMGKAIISRFRAQGYRVLVHDDNPYKNNERKINWRPILSTLISDADIIIGCTGTDITAEAHTLSTILNSIKPKYFVSTSLKDIEFNSLLIYIQEQTKQLEKIPDPLADIEYVNEEEPDSAKIVILKGGFPINFDNQEHSVPPAKIWPTHAALLGACLMAVHAYDKQLLTTANVLKLDAYVQQLILQRYEAMNPNDPTIQKTKELTNDNLKEFISQQSDGSELSVFSDPSEAHKQTQAPSSRL